MAASGLPELTCEVCGAEPAVGAAAVPGVPVSVAYGENCLQAGAHPYGILVANTMCCGGLRNTGTWWQDMVTGTLDYLGIPHEVFYRDVAGGLRQEREEMERLRREEARSGPIGPDSWWING